MSGSCEGRRLEWVQRNCGAKAGSETVGVWAERVVMGRLSRLPAWRRRLLGVLQECLGSDWSRYIVVVDLRDGVLRLGVGEPARLYQLRLRWEQRLLAVLQARLPAAGIHAIKWFVEVSAADLEG